MGVPTEEEIRCLVEAALGVGVSRAERFPTGLRHLVYDVELVDGSAVVARIAGAQAEDALRSGVNWTRILEPLGVPVPRILFCHLDPEHSDRPFVILERIPGVDLGDAYPSLSLSQKKSLAEQISGIQDRVAAVPSRGRFGRLIEQEKEAGHDSWLAFLEELLSSGVRAALENGLVPREMLDLVEVRLREWVPYLQEVRPVPFLDDATTKNVLVRGGEIQGVVDVDELGFGDPLLALGQTRVSLLTMGCDTAYTDYWSRLIGLTATQEKVVDLYGAIFCVVFLGEHGQTFNREHTARVDSSLVRRQLSVLGVLLGSEVAV